jgi:hypothetical protein
MACIVLIYKVWKYLGKVSVYGKLLPLFNNKCPFSIINVGLRVKCGCRVYGATLKPVKNTLKPTKRLHGVYCIDVQGLALFGQGCCIWQTLTTYVFNKNVVLRV